MIRASDLVGCEVRTIAGRRLGRVHDLRAETVDGGWQLTGLVVGRRGMLARLTGSEQEPLVRGDLIPWQAVVSLESGLVTVRDGVRADGSGS
jgi:sporulation protein YlmC with PRC-barrel domain